MESSQGQCHLYPIEQRCHSVVPLLYLVLEILFHLHPSLDFPLIFRPETSALRSSCMMALSSTSTWSLGVSDKFHLLISTHGFLSFWAGRPGPPSLRPRHLASFHRRNPMHLLVPDRGVFPLPQADFRRQMAILTLQIELWKKV